jgi:hypothetical protein
MTGICFIPLLSHFQNFLKVVPTDQLYQWLLQLNTELLLQWEVKVADQVVMLRRQVEADQEAAVRVAVPAEDPEAAVLPVAEHLVAVLLRMHRHQSSSG